MNRWSPPNSRTARCGSSTPRSQRAARNRAAGQPSVRWCRSSKLVGARARRRCARRRTRAPPPRVNASSLARSSASSPPARRCASLSAGSVRVTAMSAHVRRRGPERVLDRREALGVRHRLHVVEDQHAAPRRRPRSRHELVDRALDRTARLARARRSARRPRPWRTRRPRRRRRSTSEHGSLSPASRITQATRRVPVGAPRAHRGRLPVSGRRGDERQRRSVTVVQRPLDARPLDQPGTRAVAARASPRRAAATHPRPLWHRARGATCRLVIGVLSRPPPGE